MTEANPPEPPVARPDGPDDPADQVPEAADPTGVVEMSPTDAAIADAVSLLSGPALDVPDPRPTAEELEATWGPEASDGVAALRADLDGKRVGLAISGGGSLGSFEAGALRFLYDHGRIQPAVLTGNSAGALNAAKLAHGPGPNGEPIIDEVERLWRSMRINPDMWEPEPWLERIIASAQWASAIRGQITGTSNAANAMRIAVRVVGSLVRRPEETDGTFDAIKAALDAQSLLSLRPVSDLIKAELDVERVAASGIVLRIGTVSLESGELRYITETGEIHDRDDQPTGLAPVPLADGILASASIPVAFPPVRLGDEHYVDGGAREILPLELLVHHLDVDRAIAISASSPAIDRAGSFAERSILDILRRVTAEIATNETLRKELSPPGGWGPTVRLVVPEMDVHDAMTVDPALIAISFDYGWLRAADLLLGLDASVAALSTELTRTRVALRRLAGPLPSLFGTDEPDPADAPAWVDGEATLTARLREQTEARRELGAPLPPSLLGWLDATATATATAIPTATPAGTG
ncbi:MAG: hypothetical protein JWM89_2538 [Acidimicrobiales bacterium]|nr:hypothetical protein [Acidimicrobiales bacterium]